MLVYMAILATATFKPIGRVAAFLVMTAFFLYCGDFLCAVHFYCGALLAELSLTDFENSTFSKSLLRRMTSRYGMVQHILPLLMALVALFVGSFPECCHDRAGWSRFLLRLGIFLFPSGCIIYFVCF